MPATSQAELWKAYLGTERGGQGAPTAPQGAYLIFCPHLEPRLTGVTISPTAHVLAHLCTRNQRLQSAVQPGVPAVAPAALGYLPPHPCLPGIDPLTLLRLAPASPREQVGFCFPISVPEV